LAASPPTRKCSAQYTDAVTAHLQARGVEGLFFPDLHPTARLYRPIAWKLGRDLVRRGIVPRANPAGSDPPGPVTGCEPLGAIPVDPGTAPAESTPR
jgi:hypothetical protein